MVQMAYSAHAARAPPPLTRVAEFPWGQTWGTFCLTM